MFREFKSYVDEFHDSHYMTEKEIRELADRIYFEGRLIEKCLDVGATVDNGLMKFDINDVKALSAYIRLVNQFPRVCVSWGLEPDESLTMIPKVTPDLFRII